MQVTSKKWFIPLLITLVIILLGYVLVDSTYHLTNGGSCETPGHGNGQGQGRYLSQVSMVLIVIALVICALIPVLYIVLSRNMKKQIQENMKIITEIINKNNAEAGTTTAEKDTSSKLLLLKFLSYGENKVVKALIEHNGSVLQSEISRMPNMGKVRTHRITTELKKKEIITIEKYGKTNRITLTDDARHVLLK
ncbi:MAG: hypothetical protein JXA00_06080 [Candidatus Thermoplasmatota archaeon]|nr:hypothetical protein [Candidatus Thermoplasmatota archaeon]